MKIAQIAIIFCVHQNASGPGPGNKLLRLIPAQSCNEEQLDPLKIGMSGQSGNGPPYVNGGLSTGIRVKDPEILHTGRFQEAITPFKKLASTCERGGYLMAVKDDRQHGLAICVLAGNV